MSIYWSRYLAGYQAARGGSFFGRDWEECNCHLVLTQGEKSPILTYVDLDPAGKYSNRNIFARTCVQLNGTYELKIKENNSVVGGVKGLVSMMGGGGDYGCPEVTRERMITTNNKPFTKRVLGDLDFRNALLQRKRDYVSVQPTPQGDGWHLVEVGDISFESTLASWSPWVNKAMTVETLMMDPKEREALERTAQAHFNQQMDEFLNLLRSAVQAVTTWRM